ncbi:hypothetical protein AAIR29_01315 [Psychrobacter sp. FBL11]|uniref:GTPase n=1 Tax=Psychrobacter saeujeotis TaxID=3143436 RepID=A0ABU9X4Z0_9GAMM|nr:hypothetical protein [uncultured Psychrobacter sp.]
MITLSDFQDHLSHKAPLKHSSRKYVDGQEQQLRQWAASLPTQTEVQQAVQIEQVLTELAAADLDDKLRLKLLTIVACASERLITSLHKHYHYELGALSKTQRVYVDQVKSLYYSTILAYDNIIQRKSLTLTNQRGPTTGRGWTRFLTLAKTSPLVLAAAIYQSLTIYQKLLSEHNISYQPSPPHLWAAFNELYDLACQINVAHTDLSTQVIAKQAHSIHGLYVQVCLQSLLNVRAMRRSNMLLIQRLLPLWATHVHAAIEPQTETRIFVDLQSGSPPDYLTASSAINPYEAHHRCLFIELGPLITYLQQRKQALVDSNNAAIEYQLVNKVLMAMKHRYVERAMTLPTKYHTRQRATVIGGFNNIHYKVAGAKSLVDLIAARELAVEQLPRYDTQPKKGDTQGVLEVEVIDSTDIASQMRVLHLLSPEDLVVPLSKTDDEATGQQSSLLKADILDAETDSSDTLNTAPPPLSFMSLLLLQYSHNDSKCKWSMGMVRWLNLDNKPIEVEWQVLGHVLTACALRLDIRDHRGQSFMPAFMVAGDESLQTEFSIIVPSHHFQTNDKVMLRINDKQKTLCLQQCLLNSEEFSQYKVIQI